MGILTVGQLGRPGVSLLLVVFCVGCGSDDVARSVVKGTVTFDGKPVESGLIRFVPVAGKTLGAPVQLKITDGVYDSYVDDADDRGVVTGTNEVEITWIVYTGKQVKNIMGEMEEEQLQMIPEKYNVDTELTAVIESGENVLDYELTP